MPNKNSVTVPGFSLSRQNRILRDELVKALAGVVDSGMFIMGDNVKDLEREIAEYCGVHRAVGVASGSDALYISLLAMDIGAGDEVITAPFTFYATAGSITRAGAVPVFVDIDPFTWNIDPALIEEKITSRTRAVMPVHLYGCSAEMDPIVETARKHNLKVIEDAAQALGGRYRGKQVGSVGDAGCFSFFPTKNLGAFGDAGMIITGDTGIARRAAMLRLHGAERKYFHTSSGCNSRLDELQAAILKVKLPCLEKWSHRRREIAGLYNQLLAGLTGGAGLKLPAEPDYAVHVYHQYTIQTGRRDELQAYLKQQGIGTTVYYPQPLHLQEVFASLGHRPGDFPLAEAACREVLSLPMFPELTDDEVHYVATAVNGFFESN